jgi:hypothetical protein
MGTLEQVKSTEGQKNRVNSKRHQPRFLKVKANYYKKQGYRKRIMGREGKRSEKAGKRWKRI